MQLGHECVYTAQFLKSLRHLPQCNHRPELGRRADVLARRASRDRWPHRPSRTTPKLHHALQKYEIGKVRTDDPDEEARQRAIKSLLNKLTPEKFETIADKIGAVDTASPVTLQGLATQILDKAVAEPTFCPVYARLSARLCGNTGTRDLRGLLVHGCRDRLEHVDEEDVKRRKSSLGLMHAIAALLGQRLLSAKAVHECLRDLMAKSHVECLARLLRLTGAQLRGTGGYVKHIGELSRTPELESRLRFLMREILELRDNNWQERHAVEGPKELSSVTRAR